MATKTSQIQRHNNHMIENRRYDYAYDKNYHLSNQSDYIQESMKAQSSSSTIVKLKKKYEKYYFSLFKRKKRK